MKETFHFSISSESVYNQLSDLFTMLVCGVFTSSVTFAMLLEIYYKLGQISWQY